MSTTSAFDPQFSDLPTEMPIFPLPGAVVFPGQVLPLNIFEPRYLNMVFDTLGQSRMIGMVQPTGDTGEEPVPVHAIGCAARISAFQESADGRVLINLSGVCRFVIAHELELERGYRRVQPNWDPFRADLAQDADASPASVGLSELEPSLRAYFTARRLEPSWDALRSLEEARLVDFLAMTLPFDSATKQVLVEAVSREDRGRLLISALTDAVMEGGAESTRH